MASASLFIENRMRPSSHAWLCTVCGGNNRSSVQICQQEGCGLHYEVSGVQLSDKRLKRLDERRRKQGMGPGKRSLRPLQLLNDNSLARDRADLKRFATVSFNVDTPRRRDTPSPSPSGAAPTPSTPTLAPSTDERRSPKKPRRALFSVNKRMLDGLGGSWAGVPPFSGDEDKLYRWVAEPALWGRVVMGRQSETEAARVQQRIVQHHAALHDALDASGFVLWRTLQPKTKLPASSRFGPEWEMRAHEGKVPSGGGATWLRSAWKLLREATFSFMGNPMFMVDDEWCSERLGRADVTTYALTDQPASRGSRGANVAAAALESPFPAERLLRSLINAGKDDEILYIDAICADRLGAAYRLLTDIIARRRAAHPGKRLVVVLMAVVSSDVLRRYARWGFQYGGILGGASGGGSAASAAPVVVQRIEPLHAELGRFEEALAAAAKEQPGSPFSPDAVTSPRRPGSVPRRR